jgi:glutathione S-transferase
MVTLYIGNKNYSTWSLRSWVLMKTAGIPFREQRLLLNEADSSARIRARSPSARVPCLQRESEHIARFDSPAALRTAAVNRMRCE